MAFRQRFALVLLIFAVAGCGGDDGAEIPNGCAVDDQVPAAVRSALEAAAADFFTTAASGDAELVYKGVSSTVRSRISATDFYAPVSNVFRQLGVPAERQTKSVAVIKFGPDFPLTDRVDCLIPGSDRPRTFILDDHPVQASLVQTAKAGGNTYYFSTLWHQEEAGWKLAAFFAKPATLLGVGWEAYADRAAEERLAEHKRNAAILYNVAIDLCLPNAWTQPEMLGALQQKQRRISVSELPANKIDVWTVAPDDSFSVSEITYNLIENRLGLLVRYHNRAPIADTPGQARDGAKLFSHIRDRFPEYPTIFSTVTLFAFDPADREKNWFRVYHFEEAR